MLTRILNFLGWIGALLVFAGAAIRFGYPAQEQYVPYLVWSGLACIVAYGAGQWVLLPAGLSSAATIA